MNLKHLLAAMGGVLVVTCANAIDCKFRHYRVEEGLSSNTVQCIFQDSKGLIWIGTLDGLSRFDSHNFRNYRHNPDKIESQLGDNSINCICEDLKGNLWLGTNQDIFIYNPDLDTFRAFPLESSLHGAPGTIISSMDIDKNGYIWVGTTGDGIFRINSTNGSAVNYTPTTTIPFPEMRISSVLVDVDNEVWFAARKYIVHWNAAKGAFDRYEIHAPDGSAESDIYAMCEDSYGKLWVGTNSGRLYCFDKQRGTTTCHISTYNRPNTRILYLSEYRPGIMMVGTNTGLQIYYAGEKRFLHHTYDANNSTGLSDQVVYSILKDKEGGLWVGTSFGGLNYMSPTSLQFKYYCIRPEQENEPAQGRVINKFCEDPSGKIWIGTNDGGLWLFDPKSERRERVTIDPTRKNLNIHALYIDRGYLWVGTFNRGIYRMDLQTRSVRHYSAEAYGLKSDLSIYAIFRDSAGRLWVGSKRYISLYDYATDQFTLVYDMEGHNCDVLDITEDGGGNIYFASLGRGLIRYRPKSNTWSIVSDEPHASGVTLPHQARALCCTGDYLWIGTWGSGLYRYDLQQGTIEREDPRLFSQHNTIYHIMATAKELWLTTNLGLLRYNFENQTYNHYTSDDGLQGDLFCPNSGIRTSSGEIYIGGSNGFNRFEPTSITTNSITPNICFTGLQLFNHEVPIDGKILKSHIDRQRAIRLKHRQSVISIDFAALSYCAPSRNGYKYKLEGFDSDWNELQGKNHRVTYTNLSAGTYRLMVRASNNDGKWNANTAALEIVILPPWWGSKFMIVVYVLIVIALIVLTVKLILRRNERRQAALLAAQAEEHKRDLYNAKINFFVEVSHEIRTPVTLISAPLEDIMRHKNLPQDIVEDLNVIKANSRRLVDLVNQVMDFRRIETGNGLLKRETVNFNQLIRHTVDRFRPIAQAASIEITVDLPNEGITLQNDNDALIKILSNLLTNAIKFTRSRIEVTLERSADGKMCILGIKDNGIGIKPEEKDKIFELFYNHSSSQAKNITMQGFGIGLATVNLLVKRMHGRVEIDSTPGIFSLFRIYIPMDETAEEISEAVDVATVAEEKTAEAAPTTAPATAPAATEVIDGIIVTPESEERMNEAAEEESTGSQERPHLLLTEDNAQLRAFLARMLARTYEISTAEDGAKALEILGSTSIDLVVSDVVMPEMDGFELCKRMKSDINMSHIPIILLSAKVGTEDKIKGLECGADVYIEKPASIEYLMKQIASLLETRRTLRSVFSRKPFIPIESLATTHIDEKFMERLARAVETNITNPQFSVDQLATEMNMSRSILYAKIKAVADITPNDFIKLVRLRKAAELLASNPDQKIAEICYIVGFNSPSYFSKCFQAQFGVLPRDFIKQ